MNWVWLLQRMRLGCIPTWQFVTVLIVERICYNWKYPKKNIKTLQNLHEKKNKNADQWSSFIVYLILKLSDPTHEISKAFSSLQHHPLKLPTLDTLTTSDFKHKEKHAIYIYQIAVSHREPLLIDHQLKWT